MRALGIQELIKFAKLFSFNMRKRTLLLLVNIIVVSQCFLQVYVKLKPSYNRSLGGQVIAQNTYLEYVSGLDQIKERVDNVRSSLGQGYMGSFSVGYGFTPQFSVELGASYLKGKESQSSFTLRYTNSEEISTYTLTGRLFSIDPAFVFSSKEKYAFGTYVSLGFPINFISFDSYYAGKEPGSYKTSEIHRRYTGAISIGVSTKLGVSAKLNESLKIFGEIGFTYINFSPNESEVISYDVGGHDSLSAFSTSELKTIYKENVMKDYDYIDGQWVEDYDTNKPRIRQKFDTPFSFISFSLGIKFYLFKKMPESE